MDKKPLLSGPTLLGLSILFAGISLTVLLLAPPPATREEQQDNVTIHVGSWYYFEAEIMATRLYTDPSAQWCDFTTYGGTTCFPLSHGIWYAKGMVRTATSPRMLWRVCFYPGNATPLAASVGQVQTGDFIATLHSVGFHEAGYEIVADGK